MMIDETIAARRADNDAAGPRPPRSAGPPPSRAVARSPTATVRPPPSFRRSTCRSRRCSRRASRRANGGPARRSRPRSSSRRASASRRGPCARRSTRSPPTTSSCAGRARARSSRRTPRSARRCSASCASAATTAATSIRGAGCSTSAAARRRPRPRACSTLKPGDPVLVLRRVLEYAGEPVVLDEITLPAALFRGLTKARLRRVPRLDVQLLRDPVRRAHAEGAGEAPRRRRRRGDARAILGTAAGHAAARGRPRDAHLRRPAGGSAARSVHDARLSLPATSCTDARARVRSGARADGRAHVNLPCLARHAPVSAIIVRCAQTRFRRVARPVSCLPVGSAARGHLPRWPALDRPAAQAAPGLSRPAAIRLPLPAFVSILHRMTGALLFLVGIPLAAVGRASTRSPRPTRGRRCARRSRIRSRSSCCSCSRGPTSITSSPASGTCAMDLHVGHRPRRRRAGRRRRARAQRCVLDAGRRGAAMVMPNRHRRRRALRLARLAGAARSPPS